MLRQKDIFQLPEFWNYAWLKVIVLPKGSNLNEERSIFVCQQNCQNIFFQRILQFHSYRIFFPIFEPEFWKYAWVRVILLKGSNINEERRIFVCVKTNLSEYIFQRIIILFIPLKKSFQRLTTFFMSTWWLEKYVRNFIPTIESRPRQGKIIL